MNQKNEYAELVEDYMSLDFAEMVRVANAYWNMPEQEVASMTKIEFARAAALVDLGNAYK